MSRSADRARDAVFGKAADVLSLETEELTARWWAVFQRRLANRGEPSPPDELEADVALMVKGIAAVLVDPWSYRSFIPSAENGHLGQRVAQKHIVAGETLAATLDGYMRLRRELFEATRDVFRRGDQHFFDLMVRVNRCIDRIICDIAQEYASAIRAESQRPAGATAEGAVEVFRIPEYLEDAMAAIDALGREPELLALPAEEREKAKLAAAGLAGLPARRHLFRGFETERLTPHRLACRVTIARNNVDYIGEAEGPDVPLLRAEITARATLDAIRKAEDSVVQLALQGAKVLRVFDRRLVVAGVYGFKGRRDVVSLVGAGPVSESVEHAATLAVLQATNRWVPLMATQEEEEEQE